MRSFQKGEKTRLSELTSAEEVSVGVQLQASGGDVDISCFGVDAQGKLSDDRYFIFYNQKASPEGAITALGANANDREAFAVRLAALPEAPRVVLISSREAAAYGPRLQAAPARGFIPKRELSGSALAALVG